MPAFPRQPFINGVDSEPWTLRDEADRLDRICTVLLQVSLALGAASVGSALFAPQALSAVLPWVQGIIVVAGGPWMVYHSIRTRRTIRAAIKEAERIQREYGDDEADCPSRRVN
jgi:hypothetical protein